MRSMLRCTLVLAMIAATQASAQAALKAELTAKETNLKSLAQSAAALYQGRCNALTTSTPCSQPACGSKFKSSAGFDCVSGFGADCGDTCPGMTRSLSKSTIWIPQDTDFTGNVDAQAFVATTKNLDTTFSSSRTTSSGTLKAWQFIGDGTGVTRVYPGNPQSRSDTKCGDYDARTRPWYVSAASGPKDVVLLLDVSGSMNDQVGLSQKTRAELLKPAVDAILGTLTQSDFVSIVPFSTNANSLLSTPVRANEANLARLKGLWDDQLFQGSTYMGRGFTEAFSQLATGGDQTSGCTKVILFLTDGTPTDPNDWEAAVTAGQDSLVAKGMAKAHIFAVGMGNNAQRDVLQKVACNNDGVMEIIADGLDPLIALRGYYQFLAAGLVTDTSADVTVRWSNPYTDAFGLGQMVTAGVPIYDRSQSIPILVGVAGADVTLTELEQYAGYNTVVGELLTRSKVCPTTNFTQCALQQLRESSATGYVCPDPAPTVASCQANADAVTRQPCARVGSNTLNSYLCEELSSSTLLASPSISTTAAQCCASIEGGTDYSGQCSSGASITSAVIAIVIALVSLTFAV